MSLISIFSGSFCKAEEVIKEVAADTGFEIIGDASIVSATATLASLSEEKIRRAFAARTSVFNKFTREKETIAAYIKQALADIIAKDQVIISGHAVQLLPASISHLLRTALIGDQRYRLTVARESEGLSEKEALKRIRKYDENCLAWIAFVHGTQKDCLDPSLYDLFIPMNQTTVEQAGELIRENVAKRVVQTTATSKQAVENFRLAANVEVTLAAKEHIVEVEADNGAITLRINKQVLRRGRLEDELTAISMQVPGTKSVAVKTGKHYHRANIYRQHDFNLPSRVLLVEDERELAHSLSERLERRDVGSAVAYDGASALRIMEEDDPEVMIIDLKMPDIDGLEVLRKVKATHPDIEVIVLIQKGSETDAQKCLRLGAFGCLQKPVDIEALGSMLKKAHEKIHSDALKKSQPPDPEKP